MNSTGKRLWGHTHREYKERGKQLCLVSAQGQH